MMHINLGRSNNNLHNIIFGITNDDIVSMIEKDIPFKFDSKKLEIPKPGIDFYIFWDTNYNEMMETMVEVYWHFNSKGYSVHKKDAEYTSGIQVYYKDAFWVMPLGAKNGHQVCLIGLDELSRYALMSGNWLRFDMDNTSSSFLSYEFSILFGETNDVIIAAMEEIFDDVLVK